MSNEESSESRSIDERVQELKDNAKPDYKSNSSRYRELQASHGPKRLLRMLARKERDASRAGVPELLQAQNQASERSAGAATGHREAITSLAEQSAATADAHDPQAMVARERVARIRKELNSER
jgi:hypothetical protein